jgi:dTDP-4-amino-4,6-dideoxygalactose transaminase
MKHGAMVSAFEQEFATYVGAQYAIAMTNGTVTLEVALRAAGVDIGEFVVTTPLTMSATSIAILNVGARPVYNDIDPKTWLLNPRRDLPSLVVSLYGLQPPASTPLWIDDAAETVRVHRATAFTSYSFQRSKILSTGEGGMLVTNDDALAEFAKVLRNHGSKPKYYHHFVGGNFRMDTLQCALLSVKVKRYAQFTADRQRNAAHYITELVKLSGVVQADPSHCKCLSTQDAWLAAQNARIVLPVSYAHNEHIWNQFTLRVLGGKRDSLRDHLVSKQIGCDIYYPVTLDQQKCFETLPESSRAGCEVSHRVAGEVLSIPIYGELIESQRLEIIAAIGGWIAQQD